MIKYSNPIPLPATGFIPPSKVKDKLDGSIAGTIAGHAAVGAGVHVGVNAGLKQFAESNAGKGFASNLASLGAQHGMSGRVLHPVLEHAIKTVVSPEMMAEYTMAHQATSTARKVGLGNRTLLSTGLNVANSALNSDPVASTLANHVGSGFKDAPHSPIHNVHQGIQNYIEKKAPPTTGFLGGALNFMDRHTITNAQAGSRKYKSMGSLARGATMLGGAALAAVGVPVLGEHAMVNSARSIISDTNFGYNMTRDRLLEGASGASESKFKRFMIDHFISPGVGATRDIGKALSKIPGGILGRVMARR